MMSGRKALRCKFRRIEKSTPKVRNHMKCKFDIAWVGKCNRPVVDGKSVCQEHLEQICCSCGAQATRQCEETGQFVCGELLCDNCEHTTFGDGTNGGVGFNEQ